MDNILHLFAQNREHGDAIIVGDTKALLKLRQAIDEAIVDNQSAAGCFVNDGEGYNAIVIKLDDKDKLEKLMGPYGERMLPFRNEFREDAISPHNLVEDYKYLTEKAWQKTPPIEPTKTLSISKHSACLIHYALKCRLQVVQKELEIIKISKERDLTPEENNLLPDTLKDFSTEEIREQIDPWISLKDQIEMWMEVYDPKDFK